MDWQNVRTYGELADAMDAQAKIQSPDSGYAAKSEETRFGTDTGRDLAQTLQALYDSEINVTITRVRTKLVDENVYTGLDFALVCYMSYHDLAPGLWLHVDRASELAEALHRAAIRKYPNSTYARQVA